MTPRIAGGRIRAAVVLAAILACAFPQVVTAHAELLRANPPDGGTVTEPVGAVTGRYSEGLIDGSRLVVRDASGATVGTGDIDPENDQRLIARLSTPLTAGTFTVESTARSADGHVERTTWTFTVAVPATSEGTPPPSASASVAPESPPPGSPTANPAPTASPGPGDPSAGTGGVLVPILAALAIVAVGAGFLLNRGRTPRS